MSCLQLSEDRFPLIVLYILQNNTKCRNGNFFDFFRIPPFKELFFPLLRLQQLVPTSHPPSCLVNIETSRRKLCSGVQSVDKIGSEINHAWPKQKAFAHLFFLNFLLTFLAVWVVDVIMVSFSFFSFQMQFTDFGLIWYRRRI